MGLLAVPGSAWSSWRGRSPAEDVRMAAGLARAGHSQELCCALGEVSACGVCLGKLSARVLSAPKGAPGVVQAQDGAGETPELVASLGGLRGPTGSERGGILLFQAIFAALGLHCLGGKDASSGCCCWQLLRSSAAGFPWLPNPKPVELSVCTDRGKPCCEGSSLEGSRKIPVLLLVSVWLFLSFFFFLPPLKEMSFFKTILNTCLFFIWSVLCLV